MRKNRQLLAEAELALEPKGDLLLHLAQFGAGGFRRSLKKVFGPFDPDQTLWFGGGGDGFFDQIAGGILVMVAADEEFWLEALGEEFVGVACGLRRGRVILRPARL